MTEFKVGDRVRIVESPYDDIPQIGVGGTGILEEQHTPDVWGVKVDNYTDTPEYTWTFSSGELELIPEVEPTRMWADHLEHIVDVLRAVESLQVVIDSNAKNFSDLQFVFPTEGIDIQIDGIPTGWKINYRDDYWALEV
jgi:hypothetical protein